MKNLPRAVSFVAAIALGLTGLSLAPAAAAGIATPTGFRVVSTTASTITLAWDAVPQATGYRLYYGIGSGRATRHQVGDVETTTIESLRPNATYRIDIASLGNGSKSLYTPKLSVTTSVLPAPASLIAEPDSPTSAAAEWDPAPGAETYRLYWGTNPDGTGRTRIDTTDINAPIKGLRPGTTYYVRIASRANGISSEYTPDGVWTTPGFGPPSEVVAESTSPTTATISWTANDQAESYRLYWGTNPNGTGRTRIDTSATSATISGLTPNARYYVRIASRIPGHISRYSPDAAWLSTDLTPPSAAEVSNVTEGSTQISWSAQPGAQSYRLYWGTNPDGTGRTRIDTTDTITTIPGLTATTTYYVRIASRSGANSSMYASDVSWTTPAPAGCESIDYKDPAQGVQSFNDEFNGTSLDPNLWRVRDQTSLSFDNAWITKDNVIEADGLLSIAGRRLASPVTGKPKDYVSQPANRWYSTGYIDTLDSAGMGNPAHDRFSQKYGYFEMRAKLPTSNTMARGIWPAFWLRGDHTSGEIDVMEAYGAPTIRSDDPSSTYEWNSFKSTGDFSQGFARGRAEIGDIKAYDDFHTYAVNWSPTCLRYLFDDQTVGVVMTDDAPYLAGPAFDGPFNIRLNMQIGSNYWGWPDPEHTSSAFDYLIDYVRVYRPN